MPQMHPGAERLLMFNLIEPVLLAQRVDFGFTQAVGMGA